MINKNGEILLMSRKQKKSFVSSWEFPGGKLKNNENPKINRLK